MNELILFAWSIVIGICVCVAYGILGGDETLSERYPILVAILAIIHHWWIGLILMVVATVVKNVLLLGFGAGLFIDDRIYHSVELK